MNSLNYHHRDVLRNQVDLVDQQNDTFVGVLLQNLPLDQLAATTLDAIGGHAPTIGSARVQNNDQNVASVNHLLQLVEKGATRLRGCIILLDELRFLLVTPPLRPYKLLLLKLHLLRKLPPVFICAC